MKKTHFVRLAGFGLLIGMLQAAWAEEAPPTLLNQWPVVGDYNIGPSAVATDPTSGSVYVAVYGRSIKSSPARVSFWAPSAHLAMRLRVVPSETWAA